MKTRSIIVIVIVIFLGYHAVGYYRLKVVSGFWLFPSFVSLVFERSDSYFNGEGYSYEVYNLSKALIDSATSHWNKLGYESGYRVEDLRDLGIPELERFKIDENNLLVRQRGKSVSFIHNNRLFLFSPH